MADKPLIDRSEFIAFYKAIGNVSPEIQKAMRKRLNAAGRPIVAQVKQAALEIPSKVERGKDQPKDYENLFSLRRAISQSVKGRFNGTGTSNDDWAELLNTATGWDFTGAEIRQIGLRIVNLMRAFNVRQGHTRDLDAPSPRYSSAPIDGPNCGKTIAPVWDKTLDTYYELMGWDKEGKPLLETLVNLGIEE